MPVPPSVELDMIEAGYEIRLNGKKLTKKTGVAQTKDGLALRVKMEVQDP